MSIFHKPIQRTFHRHAKSGKVKCNHENFIVKLDGELFTGECTLNFQGQTSAHVKGSLGQKLTLEKVSSF